VNAPAPILRVALDTPLRRLFDYLQPAEQGRAIEPGMRVRVPFGRQQLIGIVIETAQASDVPAEKLKPIVEVMDSEPVVDASAMALLRWAAEYYHHPLGEALSAALPKSLRLGAAAEAVEVKWVATADGVTAHASGEPRRAPKQKRLLELLVEAYGGAATGAPTAEDGGARAVPHAPVTLAERGSDLDAQACEATIEQQAAPSTHGVGVTVEQLDEAMPGWRDAARQLATRGWALSFEERPTVPSSENVGVVRVGGPPLGPEQSVAVEAVGAALGKFGAFVLHGITGSGKTEVYLHLAERVITQGRGVLVLIPEIGLTPQLVGRFRERFNAPLAVLHSGLTDRERLDAWREAFSGRARIVLGTRSAVFAPVPNLGLIIVDEEHDMSFKQHEGGFRYSARDLAVVRAQRADVPIMLGSATPALETLHNVALNRYVRLSLPRRAAQAEPPRVALVDLRNHAVKAGISTPAAQAIKRHLADDGQVLVFLNRRGYAPTLLCTACGWVAPCKDCDARMTVHLSSARLKCHHCGADEPLPARCPTCGFTVKSVGQGTERIEETLAAMFPEAPLVRLDRDVVRKRGDMESAMQRMASGEARILVGTQMVTKGHDFPNVTLVVVMNADQGLFSTDFRASERLAQTIVQVAGRAGRGSKPGEVLIQTEFPEHPLLKSLLAEGYDGFARAALIERSQASWPPYSRLAAVRDSATSADAALAFLVEARKIAAPPRGVFLRGPVPAAMARRAGRYHAQLLIESTDRGALHRFIDTWLPEVEQLQTAKRVRWALDVDPLELF